LAADFENYKKRAARERQEGVRLANEALLGKLVNVLDNFEVALASEANAVAPAGDSFRAGVAMIQGQLRNVLAEAGLEEIDAAGRPFDPNQHEAVAQSESTEVPEGQVLRQMRKGYRFRERLLRPASVVVARAPAAAAGPETSTPSTDH
jgi:molecular chaperone GrpE